MACPEGDVCSWSTDNPGQRLRTESSLGQALEQLCERRGLAPSPSGLDSSPVQTLSLPGNSCPVRGYDYRDVAVACGMWHVEPTPKVHRAAAVMIQLSG